uniref:Chemokine interleukin-8-like domain-containing protein n=1 Tax=Catagonus wagneri TaxID=51154 RepID=A0A8C3W2Q5_9CETA
MKVLVATVCVLLCTTALCSSAQEKIHVPPTCCFTYTSQKIPFQYVVVYFKTSSQCPIPAVIKGLYILVQKESVRAVGRVGSGDLNQGTAPATPEVPSSLH